MDARIASSRLDGGRIDGGLADLEHPGLDAAAGELVLTERRGVTRLDLLAHLGERRGVALRRQLGHRSRARCSSAPASSRSRAGSSAWTSRRSTAAAGTRCRPRPAWPARRPAAPARAAPSGLRPTTSALTSWPAKVVRGLLELVGLDQVARRARLVGQDQRLAGRVLKLLDLAHLAREAHLDLVTVGRARWRPARSGPGAASWRRRSPARSGWPGRPSHRTSCSRTHSSSGTCA